MKTAVLLNAHFVDDLVIKRYNELKEGLLEEMDLYILFNNEDHKSIEFPEDWKIFEYSSEDILKKGYKLIPSPSKNRPIMWMNGCGMPINLFYDKFSMYDYIWCIEYDVFFNGDWKKIFRYYKENKFDFLTTAYEDLKPGWWWYDFIWFPPVIGKYFKQFPTQRKKALNTICAFSKEFLETLDILYKDGYYGYCEQTLPTAAANCKGCKFIVRDFITDGWADEDSNCWTKSFEDDEMKRDVLYHPVKNL